jgi:hypothetical protein
VVFFACKTEEGMIHIMVVLVVAFGIGRLGFSCEFETTRGKLCG